MRKTDFFRDCFRTVLSDGQPHRYGEILEYTLQQSNGTRFEGELDNHNIVHAFNLIIGPDSEYQRVRHSVYQKCTPETELRPFPSKMVQPQMTSACISSWIPPVN